MALADTAKLVASLELQDKFTGPANKINRSLSGLERGFSKIGRGTGQLAAGLGRIGVIGATVVAGGFATAVKLAGDFEAQLNTINTLSKLSDRDLRTLGEGIRSTFRETGEPLEELTAGYYDLLSAGVKLTDAQNALNLAVKLGIGGLGSTQEAVNLLTTAINTFKLDQAGAAKAADVFAQTVADGVIKVSELQGAFADVAPLAVTAGVSIEELGAGLATLTAKGALASEAGTQLNRAILELFKPTGDLAAIQERLGSSFRDLIASKGLVETLELIRIEAEKDDKTFFDLFGRVEGAKAAVNLTGESLADFRGEMEKMRGATGELNAQFAERQQGLNFQLAKLKALAQDAGITIGNALLPKLVPLVSQLNDFIQKNQGKIAQFAEDLAEGFSAFAKSVKDADFSGAIATLKILGEVGKKVVDIFLSLPPGVQAAIVAGAAVNKLSGGLLGAGAGNILGGVGNLFFDRFLARGSGPHNPVWVQSAIGGTGGLNGPGGGLGILEIAKLASVAVAAWWVSEEARKFQTENNPIFDKGPLLGPNQSILDLALGIDDNTEAIKGNTAAVLQPPVPGQGRGHQGFVEREELRQALKDKELENRLLREGRAVRAGNPEKVLPNTALRAIEATGTATAKLPPIISRQERQIAALNDRMREVRAAQLAGNSTLGRIESKPSTVEVQVNVVSNITVSDTLRKITSSLIASGKVAGLPLG